MVYGGTFIVKGLAVYFAILDSALSLNCILAESILL
jgi:hypothetical protein